MVFVLSKALTPSPTYVHLMRFLSVCPSTWATGDSRVAGPGSGQKREGGDEQDLPGHDPGVFSLARSEAMDH